MKLEKLAGATSEIWQIFMRDSSSTTGAGLTGLAFNTASLTAYYHRDTDTTATAITLATMTVGTFTSSGFKEIDATNMPGWYQFCPPNAALASGAKSCAFHLKDATNMAPLPIEVQLVAYNPDDSVRLGMTALPNATAAGVGGLLTAPTTANVGLSDLSRILGTALTETAGQLAGAFKKWFDVATPSGTVNSIPNATAGAAGGIAIVGSNMGTVSSVTGNVGGNVVGTVAGVTPAVAGDAMTLTAGERTTLNTIIKTTAITESYRANGAAPTEAQFMCEVLAHLGESSISGTTKTTKKLDHSTTAETFTLDDATNPSSITRAT